MDLVFKKVSIPRIDGEDFIMNPVELKDFIDFIPKRIYYVLKDEKDTTAHAHKIEKEFFIMITGSCIAEIDDGGGKKDIPLRGSSKEAPSDALYVGNYVWHYFKDFTPGSILLAITSTNYGPSRSDYIEDYAQYQAELAKLKNSV